MFILINASNNGKHYTTMIPECKITPSTDDTVVDHITLREEAPQEAQSPGKVLDRVTMQR